MAMPHDWIRDVLVTSAYKESSIAVLYGALKLKIDECQRNIIYDGQKSGNMSCSNSL